MQKTYGKITQGNPANSSIVETAINKARPDLKGKTTAELQKTYSKITQENPANGSIVETAINKAKPDLKGKTTQELQDTYGKITSSQPKKTEAKTEIGVEVEPVIANQDLKETAPSAVAPTVNKELLEIYGGIPSHTKVPDQKTQNNRAALLNDISTFAPGDEDTDIAAHEEEVLVIQDSPEPESKPESSITTEKTSPTNNNVVRALPATAKSEPNIAMVKDPQPQVQAVSPLITGAQEVITLAATQKPSNKIRIWQAKEGMRLENVLNKWSEAEKITLSWDAQQKYKLKSDIFISGTFENAIDVLFSKGLEKSPIHTLSNAPYTLKIRDDN